MSIKNSFLLKRFYCFISIAINQVCQMNIVHCSNPKYLYSTWPDQATVTQYKYRIVNQHSNYLILLEIKLLTIKNHSNRRKTKYN